MKDYRLSHLNKAKSIQYEKDIYRLDSYDDMLWRIEQEVLEKEINQLSQAVNKIHYLDFACGTGRILSFLENKVESSTGIDISPSMLAIAGQKVRRSKLIMHDLTDSDILRGEYFDLITAFRFFLNSQPSMRDVALRVLVPKLRNHTSLFIFNIHGNIWSYRLLTKFYYGMRGRRLNTLSYWQAKRMARTAGLDVIQYYGVGVLPKIFYRWGSTKQLIALDHFLSRIPIFKYLSYNMIFVCRRA